MKNKRYYILLVSLAVFITSFSQENKTIFKNLHLNAPKLTKVKAFYKTDKEEALKELLKIYRERKDIYKSVSKEDIKHIQNQYPKEVARSIKIADEVANNYFLFREEWDMEKTNIPYQFKNEIDWTLNPFNDREWTFMLNRHKYWTYLGKAYYLTGKEKYAKTFIKQISHWIENNPVPTSKKAHRSSDTWRTIEAGIRCENWIKTFEYVKNSKNVTPKFLEKFLNALHQHAVYINNVYTNFSKTSNWGILENHGLLNAAIFLEDFKQAQNFKNNAIKRLTAGIELQVLEDGSHWEQSPMYHNEVLHCFMNVNLLAKRTNLKLPNILKQKTKDMVFANIKWQKPNYHQPLLGDSDDTDLRGHLTLAAYLFNDAVIKSRAFNHFDYDNFFILGEKEEKNYKKITSTNPSFLSVFLESSGDFYMRSSWSKDANYASLHLKKLAGGHAHDNLLHFSIFANQRDYLVDNGRYTYVENKWREFFKTSKSHNILEVDNLANSVYVNSWENESEAWSEGVFTKIHPTFDYAEAINTTYKRLEDPVSIKRRMLFLKPDVWLIFDSFSAKKEHKYSQWFNFPNKKVAIKNKSIITTYQDKNLKIEPLKAVEISIENSWYSPEYNFKTESKRATIFKTATGFTSFISLLYFPEKTNLTYKKTPVYDRQDKLLTNKDVEAITLFLDKKEYTLVVNYKSAAIANHFFKVNNSIVHGEIILIEKEAEKTKVYVIK